MQSLCTLRDHCRQWPRNTRYQADATPYLGRTSTGWIAPACLAHSLDHLVGAAGQRQWDSDAKRLGGLEVDDQLDFHHLLNRQVSRFGTFENPPSIGANQPIGFSKVGSIAHQPARSSEPAIRINRRNGMTRSASTTSRTGRSVNKLSELTTRGTERSFANVAKAASISLSLVAFRIRISRPKARAASFTSFVSASLAALFGFTSRAMTPAAGTISRNKLQSFSHYCGI